MRILVIVSALALAVLSPQVATAEQKAPVVAKTVALEELLETVSRKSGTRFLQHANVQPEVVIGPIRTRDVSLDTLHTVLRNNGLAAVRVAGLVSIVPVSLVRQHSLRVVAKDDDSIPADEWVIRKIRPENASTTLLVPLLRPMVPKAGHLVADGASNTLIVVAPYGVATQLEGLVEAIDGVTSPQSK